MQIRTTQPADFEQILRLNEESVQFLSPLKFDRLALLHVQSAYHRVIENEGQVVAFLLAFREGSAYDSENYRWFATRYSRFLYIDRIVVSSSAQGRGLGRLFYEDLFAFARSSNVGIVACEFDLDPPNLISERFHLRFGFAQVGIHTYGAAKKLVSLQTVDLQVTENRLE